MKVKTNFDAGSINFGGDYVLFVEGEADSIDVAVLSQFLNVAVKPLGSSMYVRSISQALHSSCPNYYFLIDRDHYEDQEVEIYWKNFPNADTPNLLVWRRKELESYFIDPEYLVQSSYLVSGKVIDDIRNRVMKAAAPIVYMAAANRVIVSVREQLKRKWIELFTEPSQFPNAESALKKLLDNKAFTDFNGRVSSLISRSSLEGQFKNALDLLVGTCGKLTWGVGQWLKLLPAKAIMNSVLGSSLFKVRDRNNKVLSGNEKVYEIIKELLLPDKSVPADFNELKRLITMQIHRGNPN